MGRLGSLDPVAGPVGFVTDGPTGLNGAMVASMGTTRSAMVVEDDDAIRLVLRTNLEDEGYRVVEAETAEQAERVCAGLADVVRAELSLA